MDSLRGSVGVSEKGFSLEVLRGVEPSMRFDEDSDKEGTSFARGFLGDWGIHCWSVDSRMCFRSGGLM